MPAEHRGARTGDSGGRTHPGSEASQATAPNPRPYLAWENKKIPVSSPGLSLGCNLRASSCPPLFSNCLLHGFSFLIYVLPRPHVSPRHTRTRARVALPFVLFFEEEGETNLKVQKLGLPSW